MVRGAGHHRIADAVKTGITRIVSCALMLACAAGHAGERLVVLVAERDSPAVSLMQGETLRATHRLQARTGLLSDVALSRDDTDLYLASRDGWVSRYEPGKNTPVAETRVANEATGFALSGDDRWLLVATAGPEELVVLDSSTLARKRAIPLVDEDGVRSRASAVRDAPARQSFVIALRDTPRLWEMSWDPHAEPLYRGMVHDFRLGEGIAEPGQFAVRATRLAAPLQDFVLDATDEHVVGTVPGLRAPVINLDARRTIAVVDTAGALDTGNGFPYRSGGYSLLFMPHRNSATASIIDTGTWRVTSEATGMASVLAASVPPSTVRHCGHGRYVQVTKAGGRSALVVHDALTHRRFHPAAASQRIVQDMQTPWLSCISRAPATDTERNVGTHPDSSPDIHK